MTTPDPQQILRARNSILGALVADAATMGFHWCYSQRRIAELAPVEPEFRQPSEADYEGGVGYFAHGMKTAGEFSHYGEQAWVMLHAMASQSGRYERRNYQEAFRQHFGYGGQFRGYIDRPTRETLDTIYRREYEAMNAAAAIPFEGDPNQQSSIRVKMLAAAKRYQGERLVEEARHITSTMDHAEACLRYACSLIDALTGGDEYPGAHDEQLPAISKLPVLVARYADSPALIELATDAIRVTNNTPRALDYGQVATALLAHVVNGGDVPAAIQAGLQAAQPTTRAQLEAALGHGGNVREVTREFGLHCDLGAGVPSILANLASATNYIDAVRQNIYAGGDNCGRSILLGAVLGAVFGVGGAHGIPEHWIDRLHNKDAILSAIDQVIQADAPE